MAHKKKTRMGRPPGSGGPPELRRRNRVVVMVTDAELEALHAEAEAAGLPPGTLAYQLLARALKRQRR